VLPAAAPPPLVRIVTLRSDGVQAPAPAAPLGAAELAVPLAAGDVAVADRVPEPADDVCPLDVLWTDPQAATSATPQTRAAAAIACRAGWADGVIDGAPFRGGGPCSGIHAGCYDSYDALPAVLVAAFGNRMRALC
jgi:hypothetical protein